MGRIKPLTTKQTKHWYAVYTKSRAEKKVKQFLDEKEIECYLPLVKKLRQWSDRKKWVYDPLIRSYIFVKISDDREYLNVLDTDGVVCFITFEGKAAKIPDKQINDIKLLLASEKELEVTHENLEPGMDIEVIAGPLKGLEGKLLEIHGKNKVKIEIEAIGQSILVEIATVYLKKVKREFVNIKDK